MVLIVTKHTNVKCDLIVQNVRNFKLANQLVFVWPHAHISACQLISLCNIPQLRSKNSGPNKESHNS